MQTKQIDQWSQITDRIGQDLALYSLYNASAMAADTVDGMLVLMRNSEYLSEETLRSVYMDILFGLASEELEDHLSSEDEDVEISAEALEEGFHEFVNWRDLTNEDDALAYLRYLLDWEEEHVDWCVERPQPFEEYLMHKS
jgi:hypothetical protein